MAAQSKLYYAAFRPHITFTLYHDRYERDLIIPLRNILKNKTLKFLLGVNNVQYVVIKFLSGELYVKIYMRRSDLYVTTFGNVAIEGNNGVRYSFKNIVDIPFSENLGYDEQYSSLGEIPNNFLSFNIFQSAVRDLIRELNSERPKDGNFKRPLHIIIKCLAEGTRFPLISRRLHQTDDYDGIADEDRKYLREKVVFDQWMEVFTRNWRQISIHALLWLSYDIASNDVVFRYLCPINRLHSVLGRGAKTVRDMRVFSGSSIRIGEINSDCPFVVITLHSHPNATRLATGISDGDTVCSSIIALFTIHDKVVEYETSFQNDVEAPEHVASLLVPKDSAKYLIGLKNGMRNEFVVNVERVTETNVVVKLANKPDCALADDYVLQVSGRADKVREALFMIANHSAKVKRPPTQTSFSSFTSLGSKPNPKISDEQKRFLAGAKMDPDYTYTEHLHLLLESPFLCTQFLKVHWDHQGQSIKGNQKEK